MEDRRFGDPGKTVVFSHGEDAGQVGRGGADQTQVLRADADPDAASAIAPSLSAEETAILGRRARNARESAGETQVICSGADATQVLGAGRAGARAEATRAFDAVGDAAFSPQGYIPEQAVNPQKMPDAAFEPRGAAYSSPSATSVMPAELIAERRRRNQKEAGRGARFSAGSFAQEAPARAYQDPYAQQDWQQPAYAPQAGWAMPQAPAPEKKKHHGCLVAFITVLVVLVILGAAALFALDYAVQQTGVPKEEILSRIAKPVQDFINGLAGKG